MRYFRNNRSSLTQSLDVILQRFRKTIINSNVAYAGLLIIGLVVIGSLGYSLLEGWSLIDSVYATIITITTVGYGDLTPETPAGRIFAIFFTLIAIGVAGYALSTVAVLVIEHQQVQVKQMMEERKMKQIADLNDHIILCGGGYIGKRVAHELYQTGTPFVIIEPDESILRWTLLYLHQDYMARKLRQFHHLDYVQSDTTEYERQDIAELAEHVGALYLQEDNTDDAALMRAGIERARGLITTMEDDRDNLFTVLSARQLAKHLNNPRLRIISRVVDEPNKRKLKAAGADAIVSPNVMGGFQIASSLLQPEVAAYWDYILSEYDETVRFKELYIEHHSELIGQTVSEVCRRFNQVVIAIKRNGTYIHVPDPATVMEKADILIVVGTL
ncbi:MAG TPA: NAD-binding protein [Anaerolineae bacterium]|nr:NAD-binding protein [Anaerolineae bacterium]MCB0226916.1 NAD-binding protein [Anaerolineae bacterium]HRV92727.1 NAD-binding protein [Anaerolineae bacterium]